MLFLQSVIKNQMKGGTYMYQKLVEKMRQKNITTHKLAKLSNITPQDLYSALSGKKPFFPNWRKRVAEALDSTVEELFSINERGDSLED